MGEFRPSVFINVIYDLKQTKKQIKNVSKCKKTDNKKLLSLQVETNFYGSFTKTQYLVQIKWWGLISLAFQRKP